LNQVLGGIVAASLALSPVLAHAACFTEAEWRAAHVRVLQTDLQVAALECQYVAGYPYAVQYNAFVAKMGDGLAFEAKHLIAHFQRVFGAGWGRELDSYVTLLANEASDRSMKDADFCAHAQVLLQSALALEKPQLEQAALGYVTDHGAIGEQCGPAPQVAADARPK
jgi:hypothetical protein